MTGLKFDLEPSSSRDSRFDRIEEVMWVSGAWAARSAEVGGERFDGAWYCRGALHRMNWDGIMEGTWSSLVFSSVRMVR